MTQTEIARLAYLNATEEQQAEILEMYPDLLKGELFKFTEDHVDIIGSNALPFMIGNNIVSKKNKLKCIALHSMYTCEVSQDSTGYTIIKFYEQP